MASNVAIRLYELGVRLAQATVAFPPATLPAYGESPLAPAARNAALHRLRRALSTASQMEALRGLADAGELPRLDDCRQLWRNTSRGLECYRDIPIVIAAIREGVDEYVSAHGTLVSDAKNWFRLGRAIADGRGAPDSEGRLTLRDGRLTSVGSIIPAHWEWRDEVTVHELLQWLGADQAVLFPPYRDLGDDDLDRLPGIADCYWGWWSIERGIGRLDQQRQQFTVQIRGDESIVVIGGEEHRVNETQARILTLVFAQRGEWISSSEMMRRDPLLDGLRIDRQMQGLPRAVLRFIESGKGRRGYRLKMELLTA